MRTKLFLIAILALCTFSALAQNCNVQGVIRYKYNDYIGYKADLGAAVYFIPKSDTVKFLMTAWNRYLELAPRKSQYLLMKEDYYSDEYDETIRNACRYGKAEEETLERIDGTCATELPKVESAPSFVTVVDNSGKYEISVPYGEYYIFIRSNNRSRMTVTELLGNVHLEEIKLNTPMKLFNHDFEI